MPLIFAAACTTSCAGLAKRIEVEERTKPIAVLHPPRPARCPTPLEAPAIEIVDRAGVPAIAIAAGEWIGLMKALECRATYLQALEALLDHYRAGHDVPASKSAAEPGR